jgi:hypothetical protein
MKIYTPQPTYETHDIYLAAALRLNNFKLLTFSRDDRGRGVFVFEDRDDRPQFVQRYFSGELDGNLKNFISTWKDLKGLLYETGK